MITSIKMAFVEAHLKTTFIFLTLIISVAANATSANSPPSKPTAHKDSNIKRTPLAANKKSTCEAKVKKLILETVKIMGFNEDIGFEISKERSGEDIQGKELTTFTTSIFFVEEGNLTNSGATIVVRSADKECEPIKSTVSIGG